MVDEITKRIAISGIDFDEIPLPIVFRVFESAVRDGILKILVYQTQEGSCYGIAEFDSEKSSKDAYNFLDGVEIETTGKIFDLSFVPDNLELDKLIAECDNSKDFNDYKIKTKKLEINEDMIELSEEIDLGIVIPDEFKTEAVKEVPIETDKKDKGKPAVESKENNKILSAFKEDEEKKEEDNFKVDIQDERFKEIFENDDFVLDASNKKFKHQKISKTIAEEKFKKIDEN